MKLIILVCCLLISGIDRTTTGQSSESGLREFDRRLCNGNNCRHDLTYYGSGETYDENPSFYNNVPDGEKPDDTTYKLDSSYYPFAAVDNNRFLKSRSIQEDDTINEVNTQFPSLSNWQIKRTQGFSSWGGKRTPGTPIYRAIRFPYRQREVDDSVASKRENKFAYDKAFSSWGGKRSLSEEDLEEYTRRQNGDDHRQVGEFVQDDTNHKILRRDASMNTRKSDREFGKLCSNFEEDVKLADLLKEFLKQSNRRPGQKKNTSTYEHSTNGNKMEVKKPELVAKTIRKGFAFFPWGGKRNSKN